MLVDNLEVTKPALKRGGATVEIQGVDAWYGTAMALRNVTLTAQPGAITALIGPSGCGKSTLLRSINRLNDIVPSYRLAGSVRVNDQEVYDRRLPVEDLRRRVGMLFQRPAPLPMSIYDDVAFGPRLHKIAPSRTALKQLVEQSLRRAVLWEEVKDRLHHPGRSLSGGQQQRLCIARALAVEPEVLLMDEPCAALDPVATAKIEELLRSLTHDTDYSITVIIVTHNMQQARRIADVTAVMLLAEEGGGEMVEAGPTKAIFDHPRDPRTGDYVAGRFG